MPSPLLLLRKIEAIRGEIWEENGKLKFRLPEAHAPELIQELSQQKAQIIKALQAEQAMKKTGWLILSRWEAYEKRITPNHSLFIFRENNGWIVWSATWQPGGGPAPIRERVLTTTATLKGALHAASDYIDWRQRKNKRPA